jgi:hypothetical protein
MKLEPHEVELFDAFYTIDDRAAILMSEILDDGDIRTVLDEKQRWLRKVLKHSAWKMKPGALTKGSPAEVARYLRTHSKNFSQAMGRLNFYINIRGRKIPKSRRRLLAKTKLELRKLYGLDKMLSIKGNILK